MGAIQGGCDWAAKNLTKRDPFRLERMDKTAGKIIIDGNAAAAIGCMLGGRHRSSRGTRSRRPPRWPSRSSTTASSHRKDPETGKPTFAIVQAEDELAAARHGPGRRLGGRARDDDDVRARASP